MPVVAFVAADVDLAVLPLAPQVLASPAGGVVLPLAIAGVKILMISAGMSGSQG